MPQIKIIGGVLKMDRDEAQEFWEIILQMVQQRLSKPMYDTWIAPLSGEIVEGNTIVIRAASEFAEVWIKERYKHHFADVLSELTGQVFKVQVIGSNKTTISNTSSKKAESPTPTIKKVNVGIPVITPSYSSIKLRRDNARISGLPSLYLPLADIGESHAEKRIFDENERIRKRLESWENGPFDLFRLFRRCKR